MRAPPPASRPYQTREVLPLAPVSQPAGGGRKALGLVALM
jgi:hypothetical protein